MKEIHAPLDIDNMEGWEDVKQETDRKLQHKEEVSPKNDDEEGAWEEITKTPPKGRANKS